MTQSDDPYGLRQLEAVTKKAAVMGGPARIEKQHAKNRMSIRERIEYLLDPGSFDEQGLLVYSEFPEEKEKTPQMAKFAATAPCGLRTKTGAHGE